MFTDSHGRSWSLARSNELLGGKTAPLMCMWFGANGSPERIIVPTKHNGPYYRLYEWDAREVLAPLDRSTGFQREGEIQTLLTEILPSEVLCITPSGGNTDVVKLLTLFDITVKHAAHQAKCYAKYQQLTSGRPFDPFDL